LRYREKVSGWERHLEGWQAGALGVFVALVITLLVVPRKAVPHGVPEPVVDRVALERQAARDDGLADRLLAEPLPHDVRALGSAIRAFGVADATGDQRGLVGARSEMVAAASRSLAIGVEPLVILRAHHTRAFLEALEQWRQTGVETPDLVELGGGFLGLMRKHRWVDESVRPAVVHAPRSALRAMFKKRWNEITGLADGEPTRLTLDEERALLRFLIRNPTLPIGLEARRPLDDPRATFENEYILRKIGELRAIDPGYPADFASGIVLYRLRRYPESVRAFQRHLDARPDGPHGLRCQNFLRTAIGMSQGEELL
jgi:hypothetical protein